MKASIKIVLLIIGLLLAFAQPSNAQKFIKIDELLKLNSQAMKVKRKGAGGVGKYEFGPYKVISGKGGWETTTSKSPFFSDNTSMESSSKKSFVFVNDRADTSVANIRVAENVEIDEGSWFFRTFTDWSVTEVQKAEGVFETVFSFSADTTLWSLVVIYPTAVEIDGMYQSDDQTEFRGLLTDNHTFIEISVITENEDGKRPLLNPFLGYEFWQGTKSLAAVQAMPLNKWYVWIQNDLDPQLKFVLASAATAMLVKTF